jgi:uncharacterized protein (TIGR02466 family)
MPIHRLFPTFVFQASLDIPHEIRLAAINHVLSITKEVSGGEFRRVTADKTIQTLHLEPEMRELIEIVSSQIYQFLYDEMKYSPSVTSFYIGRCWPTVQSFGGEGALHFHAGAVFSGVLYLQVPQGSGGIEFTKPFKTAADNIFKTEFSDFTCPNTSLDIEANDLLLFNSELWHKALSNSREQNEARVAIAFDIYSMSDIRNISAGLPYVSFLRPIKASKG